jgi:hypothetical protein
MLQQLLFWLSERLCGGNQLRQLIFVQNRQRTFIRSRSKTHSFSISLLAINFSLIKSHALVWTEKNLVRVSIPGGRRALVLRSHFHSAYSLAAFLFNSDIIISLRDCCSFCCTLAVAAFPPLPLLPGMVLIVITAHIILPNEQVFAFDPSNILPPIVEFTTVCAVSWPRLAHQAAGTT